MLAHAGNDNFVHQNTVPESYAVMTGALLPLHWFSSWCSRGWFSGLVPDVCYPRLPMHKPINPAGTCFYVNGLSFFLPHMFL
jgi:hypothetical protein